MLLVLLILVTSAMGRHLEQSRLYVLEEHIASCLQDIANTYFPTDLPVVVQTSTMIYCEYRNKVFGEIDDIIFQTLNVNGTHHMITFGCYNANHMRKNYKKYNSKLGSVVLIIPDLSLKIQVRAAGNMMKRINSFMQNTGARFAIVMKHFSRSVQEQLRPAYEVMDFLWREYSISDVIVIVPQIGWSKVKRPKLEIVSWRPEAQSDHCLKELDRLTIFNEWDPVEKQFLFANHLYPRKDRTSSWKCVKIVGIIQTPPFVVVDDKRGYIYGSYINLLFTAIGRKNLFFADMNYQKESLRKDIEIPTYFTNQLTPGNTHMAYPHFRITLNWYVRINDIPRWQGLLRTFSPAMWVLVTLAYVLGSGTFWIIHRRQQPNRSSLTTTLVNTLRTYLGTGVPDNYRGKVAVAFFSLWLFYCIQVYTAYQAAIFGFLVSPGQIPPISSIEELEESGYEKWTSVDSQIDSHIDDDHFDWEYTQYQVCKVGCSVMLMKKNGMALLSQTYFQDIYIPLIYTKHGKPQIAKVGSSVFDFVPTIAVNRFDGYLVKHIDSITERIVDSGIWDHWTRLSSWQFVSRYQSLENIDKPAPVSASVLEGPFFMLGAGLLLSVITFVFELIIHAYSRYLTFLTH